MRNLNLIYFYFLFIVLFTQCQQKRVDKVIVNPTEFSVIKPTEVIFKKASLKAEPIVSVSNDSIKEIADNNTLISPHSGKKEYDYAYNEMNLMLSGQKPKDVKRAIFLVENAYYGGNLDYNRHCLQLDTIKTILRQIVRDKHLEKNPIAYNYAIFSYMKEQNIYNKGRTCDYDFDDYLALKDPTKTFVTKLLNTRKGNCHSLPLLYKILANEMGADAHIAFAPLHVYIKHLDDKKEWVNIELTSATFPSDGHIMSESGITLEAAKSGIFMHALDELQTIAYCMAYLGETYFKQYGAKDFVLKTSNKALEYYPNLLAALLLKVQVYGIWHNQVNEGLLLKGKSKSQIEHLKELRSKLTALTNKLSKLGYKSVSQKEYARWQNQSEKQKNKVLQARR